MSSKRRTEFFNLLTLRLTLYFVALFLISSALVFIIAYLMFSPSLMRDLDGYLTSEAKEIATFHEQNGLARIEAVLRNESESHGAQVVFFRLFSPANEVIAYTDPRHWSGLGFDPDLLRGLGEGEKVFTTVSLPGRGNRVRLIYKKFGQGHVIQIGHVVRLDEITSQFGKIFSIALAAMLFCGGLVGWLIVRRAMRGVERVSRAAERIGRGHFDSAVPLKNEGLEIDRLASAFNDMADRIRRLVGQLKEVTDNIAHDLRSPVNRIRGLTEMALTQGRSEDDWREIGAEVIEECDRLVGLIDTMLEIAQANSRAMRIPDQMVDLGVLAADAVELFQPLAEDKGLALELDPSPEPVRTRGDVSKLQRVVANLLDNAIKFTPPGGRVVLSLADGPDGATVRVADTGLGIPPENLPRVFDRFFRGDQARSTPGNGLGLSLVQALILAHSGRVEVESEPGLGSIFTIHLPPAG